jgi:superfamily II DNA or RNA helicase
LVWTDLVSSADPTLVVGYSSIGELINLISDWDNEHRSANNQMRLVFGAEPFTTVRHTFRTDRTEFTEEARRYWLEERGISLRSSEQVLQSIEAIKRGVVASRFIHGPQQLHAKIFRGTRAATIGSSNFTGYGLGLQFEANARFDAGTEPKRYRELSAIADNYWRAGDPWDDELLLLLEGLLQMVSWQEALARACADLLEGNWAAGYMPVLVIDDRPLWPSQRSGIAEALWITENVGSVLVADATGSGKTRMGAHLVRAARDRLWQTGRVRSDLTALVGPPAVIDTWEAEAIGIGLMLSKVSHGLLSRRTVDRSGREEALVRGAQILAIDEAHNFLNAGSNRTQQVRDSLADNVMLFTATPISKGAGDLLNLVGLLGPDNFEDRTLEILNRLERRRGFGGGTLTADEVAALRREIQRFTVRRTKAQINQMVDRDPEPYIPPGGDRPCRYPTHHARIYPTGETSHDEELANQLRPIVDALLGISQLEREIAVPAGLRLQYSDAEWLRFRIKSAHGLARHHVLEALRSSRVAAIEHLLGTAGALSLFGMDPGSKTADTGDVMTKVARCADEGPPTLSLDCEVPAWLTDVDLWRAACNEEFSGYQQISELVKEMSDAREESKAAHLADLSLQHERVLAFDRHPITLARLAGLLGERDLGGAEILLAIGKPGQRKKVVKSFSPSIQAQAIALCSDAMNEGLNLQGASCIVHLDLPTTLRVAEQRVGRVDRMDSPHPEIEAWWPKDGPAFATRAYEKLIRRARESEDLLGSNLTLPEFEHGAELSAIVKVEDQIEELAESERVPWDGIQDALEPVRQMVAGPTALLTQEVYEYYRGQASRVLARVSPLRTTKPWAFLSVSAIAHGAPRWLIVDPTGSGSCVTDLHDVAEQLRALLSDDPPSRDLDRAAIDVLNRCLDVAIEAERRLLPRRMIRALEQMQVVVGTWASEARRHSDEDGAARWDALATLASDRVPKVDPYLVAECWLGLIAPVMAQHRLEAPRSRYILLRDITQRLAREPMNYDDVVKEFTGLPAAIPLDERVTACILGVPDPQGSVPREARP